MSYSPMLMAVAALTCIAATLISWSRGEADPAAPAWLVAGVLLMLADAVRRLQGRVAALERRVSPEEPPP